MESRFGMSVVAFAFEGWPFMIEDERADVLLQVQEFRSWILVVVVMCSRLY